MSVSDAPWLLVVDDEQSICTIVKKCAGALGFQVETLIDGCEVLRTLEQLQPVVLVLDLKMPNVDGIELLRSVGQMGTNTSVLLMSGMDQRALNTAENLAKSYGVNVLGSLRKPFSREELQSCLSKILDDQILLTGDDLESAFANGEIVTYYQPKIFWGSGAWTIGAVEALVRWKHPTHGLLMPGDFLESVQNAGLMKALTDNVLQTAVQQLASWRNQGLDMAVAVNIPGDLIEDLEFPDRLQRLLDEYDVPGAKLGLELTESAAMTDLTKAMDIFVRLRMNDIELSIDDFGTGFSSLQKLYQLPFNELKIDRSFVSGLPGSDEARAVVRATIDLGHALNLAVCAEGIESAEALAYLERVSCDRAQGFLVSRAVPASQIAGVIDAWSRGDEKLVAQR